MTCEHIIASHFIANSTTYYLLGVVMVYEL